MSNTVYVLLDQDGKFFHYVYENQAQAKLACEVANKALEKALLHNATYITFVEVELS